MMFQFIIFTKAPKLPLQSVHVVVLACNQFFPMSTAWWTLLVLLIAISSPELSTRPQSIHVRHCQFHSNFSSDGCNRRCRFRSCFPVNQTCLKASDHVDTIRLSWAVDFQAPSYSKGGQIKVYWSLPVGSGSGRAYANVNQQGFWGGPLFLIRGWISLK